MTPTATVSQRHNPGSVLLVALGVLLPLAVTLRLQIGADAAPAMSSGPQSTECKCADLPALISRRREVVAAINAIDAQMAKLAADEKRLGQVVGYSDGNYSYFADAIRQAIDAAHDRSTPQVHGPTTFNRDCSPTTSSADNPSCFWQGLALNEEQRRKWCEAKVRGGGDIIRQTLGGNWMTKYPLANFAQVDRDGYQAEKAYLDQTIRNLFERCKFSRWSGEVTVSYNATTKFSKSLPAAGAPQVPHQNRRTEETNINEAVQATITLVDGIAQSDGMAFYSIRKSDHEEPEIWCHASTLGNKAWVPWSRTASDDYKISGPVYRGGDVSVSFRNDGTYTINVSLPSGSGSGTSSTDSSETGECAAKSNHQSFTLSDKRVGGGSVKGKGTGKQTDLTLDGSDNPKPNVISKDTITDITVTWHLKRSRPQ